MKKRPTIKTKREIKKERRELVTIVKRNKKKVSNLEKGPIAIEIKASSSKIGPTITLREASNLKKKPSSIAEKEERGIENSKNNNSYKKEDRSVESEESNNWKRRRKKRYEWKE